MRNRIINFFFILVFIGSGFSTAYYGYNYYQERKDFSQSEQITKELSDKFTVIENFNDQAEIKSTEMKVDLDGLKNEIPDTVAWIYAPDISLSEVVVRGEDNEYYLKHSPQKEWSNLGTIFLDSQNRANLEENFVNYIFGHKSSKSNVRFSNLDFYFDSPKENSFYLYQNKKQYKYKVIDTFTVIPTNTLYPQGLFNSSEYSLFKEALLENGSNQSVAENISKDKKYTLLITCKESWDNSERRIVLGELVETLEY